MKLSSGYPFWLIRNGIPYDYPKLQENTRADVVVMGGGISGALTAYYLRLAGVDAMVVDGRTIGLGSTCASTSLLQYEIDTPLSRLQDMIGTGHAIHAYQLCAASIDELGEIAKDNHVHSFSAASSVYYADTEKDIPFLLTEFAARKEMGIKINWLDQQYLEHTYGILAPAAILSEPAAQTDAYTLTHALHQHNCAKGMRVYDRTYINTIDTHKRGVMLTTKEGFSIRCKKLVMATGYEAVKYIRKKIVQLSSTYAVASEQLMGKNTLRDHQLLLWSTADPYLYARATADNRIITGGRDEDFFSPAKRDELITKKSRLLVKDFQKRVPGMPFRAEFSWAGVFGSTKDGLPYIGAYAGLPNCLFALGFGGNGITFSLIAAKIVTDLIKGKTNRDAALFSFDR